MEERSSDQPAPQLGALTEEERTTGDWDVRAEVMNRAKRQEARAWVQAYRLIRGGADEVVEFIESSQHTIELLMQELHEAACRRCELAGDGSPEACDACRRRRELLAELA